MTSNASLDALQLDIERVAARILNLEKELAAAEPSAAASSFSRLSIRAANRVSYLQDTVLELRKEKNELRKQETILLQANVSDDDYASLDELLRQPLPRVDVSGSSRSVQDRDEDRHTHPTTVSYWSGFSQEVKERLCKPDIAAMREMKYYKCGYHSEALHLSEDGAVASLCDTACGRLNLLFRKHQMNKKFGIHPGKRKSDSQVAEQQHVSTVKVHPDEGHDVPDIVMLERRGPVRHVLFALEVKTGFRLKGVQDVNVARAWTMFKEHAVHPGLSADAAYNICHAISQELGYMSRRGHLYGMISTYHHSWFLRSDGKGGLWISDTVGADARGDAEKVSVTEAMLFSALCSSESVVEPYATARKMGEKPLSKEQFSKLRRDTLRPRMQAAASCLIDQEATSADSGGQHVPHAPECDLELTLKLSKTVFFGRYGSSVAAVRMALSVEDICHAQTEVEAYHRLQQLQGKHVPKLLGYGQIGQGFCVATSYIEGEPFDWHSKIHRSLDGQLLAVLDTVHSFGICHQDLHQGNILVTPHKQIFLLDFAGANMKSNAEDRIAERNHMAMLLSLRASCHA